MVSPALVEGCDQIMNKGRTCLVSIALFYPHTVESYSKSCREFISKNLILVFRIGVVGLHFLWVECVHGVGGPKLGDWGPKGQCQWDCLFLHSWCRCINKHLIKGQYCATLWAGILRKKEPHNVYHVLTTKPLLFICFFFQLFVTSNISHLTHNANGIVAIVTTHLWHHHLCHY